MPKYTRTVAQRKPPAVVLHNPLAATVLTVRSTRKGCAKVKLDWQSRGIIMVMNGTAWARKQAITKANWESLLTKTKLARILSCTVIKKGKSTSAPLRAKNLKKCHCPELGTQRLHVFDF